MERCWSGLSGAPGERVSDFPTVGSNPTLSAGTTEGKFVYTEVICHALILEVCKRMHKARYRDENTKD